MTKLTSPTVISHAGVEDVVNGEQVQIVPVLLLMTGGNDSSLCCLRSSFSARLNLSLRFDFLMSRLSLCSIQYGLLPPMRFFPLT